MSDLPAPFLAAARDGRLVLPRCTHCAAIHFYPRPFCPACHGTEFEWVQSTGKGRVKSFTIVHERINGTRIPTSMLAVVQLDEGVSMLSRLVGTPVRSGARVEVRIDREGVDAGLVSFAVIETSDGVVLPS